MLIEPGTAGVWDSASQSQSRVKDSPDAIWAYDGLGKDRSGSLLGIDKYQAHVQSDGTYHYHAISEFAELYSKDANTHSELVAFAIDGFPIFGPRGYADDGKTITTMYGNYVLKNNGGERLAINGQNPGGNYDGTFIQDYEFAAGTGDVDPLENGIQTSTLDQANGHIGKVPARELDKYDFDILYKGERDNTDDTYTVYHYHLTPNFPSTPRSFYGTPDSSFLPDRRNDSPRGAGGRRNG